MIDDSSNMRKIAKTLNVNHWTVWKILKDKFIVSLPYSTGSGNIHADFPPRIALCQWILYCIPDTDSFYQRIQILKKCNKEFS